LANLNVERFCFNVIFTMYDNDFISYFSLYVDVVIDSSSLAMVDIYLFGGQHNVRHPAKIGPGERKLREQFYVMCN